MIGDRSTAPRMLLIERTAPSLGITIRIEAGPDPEPEASPSCRRIAIYGNGKLRRYAFEGDDGARVALLVEFAIGDVVTELFNLGGGSHHA